MAHGSMMKLENGKFRVCMEYGFDENNKRIRKYKTFNNKKDAELALSRHNVAMEDGTGVLPRTITVEEWLRYWLENIYSVRAAETSVYAYRNMIENHIIPALGKRILQKLRAAHVQQYYSMLMKEKGLSPNTVIKHHDLLNSALTAAVKQEYVTRNIMSGVERPKKIWHEASIYNPEQLQKLFEIVRGDRLEIAVKLGAYLGLRRKEICGLKWRDIDFQRRIIHICRAMTQVGKEIIIKDTKTYASDRKLFIPDGLEIALKEEKGKQEKNKDALGAGWTDSGYVVVWEDGRPYRPNYISELFTKFLKDNGLPKIVLHELRHTFASLSNEAGIQEFNIGKALGHANVGTTKKIYTHLFDDRHTAAVDAVANIIDGRNKENV